MKVETLLRCARLKNRALSLLFFLKLHIRIALIELIPNITFLFEFDQVEGGNLRNTESTKKTKDLHHFEENLDLILFRSLSLSEFDIFGFTIEN